MKTSELLKDIEQAFDKKLQEKTSWGRNEVKSAYQSVVNDILLKIADNIVKDE